MTEHSFQRICQNMLVGHSISVKLCAAQALDSAGVALTVLPTPPIGYRYDASGRLFAAPVFVMRIAPSTNAALPHTAAYFAKYHNHSLSAALGGNRTAALGRLLLTAAAWPALGLVIGGLLSLLAYQTIAASTLESAQTFAAPCLISGIVAGQRQGQEQGQKEARAAAVACSVKGHTLAVGIGQLFPDGISTLRSIHESTQPNIVYTQGGRIYSLSFAPRIAQLDPAQLSVDTTATIQTNNSPRSPTTPSYPKDKP